MVKVLNDIITTLNEVEVKGQVNVARLNAVFYTLNSIIKQLEEPQNADE